MNRARYLATSNHGRHDGWYVELDVVPRERTKPRGPSDDVSPMMPRPEGRGIRVAELSDYRHADMFWDSYAIRALSDEGEAAILDDAIWNACRFAFRSKGTGELITTAFASGGPTVVRGGRVLLRGLHLPATPSIDP